MQAHARDAVTIADIRVGTSAKYVLVTGESLLQGYARLGKWAVWLLLACRNLFDIW
jgi:hypothetical protein